MPARKSFARQVHDALVGAHARGESVSGTMRHRLATYPDNSKVELFAGDVRAAIDAAPPASPAPASPDRPAIPTVREVAAALTLALAHRLLRA